jgi:hypothetical protein
MDKLVIQYQAHARHESCGLCGQRTFLTEGPQLFAGALAVCRRCGAQHTPALASLLDLGAAAQRVGRIRRHSVSPPLTALLDLARAAEDYAHAPPPRARTGALAGPRSAS